MCEGFPYNYSQWTQVEFLVNKSEVFEAYKIFEAMCKTQFNTWVKILHFDWEGEYTATNFQSYFKSQGTQIKLTTHDTLQYNGIAEQLNRSILEHTRALLHASRFPKFLWAYAISHVVWLMNWTSSKAIQGKTLFELVYDKKLDLSGLRKWGSNVWVHQSSNDKLGGYERKG